MTKQLFTLSDAAKERIGYLIENSEEKIHGIKVGVTKGGCAGMSYTIDYAKEIDPAMDIVEYGNIKIFIDPMAIMYLVGTEMDFIEDKLSSRFTFNNPNETGTCGCGESFKV